MRLGTFCCALPLALCATLAPARAAGPGADGSVEIGGTRERISLRARGAPAPVLLDRLFSERGWRLVVAEGDRRPVSIDIDGLPAREAAARIGDALGGLVPLQVTYRPPWLPAGIGPERVTYLVREGTRRQKLLAAYCATQTDAHHALHGLLEAEGGALLPDAVAFLADPSRDERQRAHAVHLLAVAGGPAALPPLLEALEGQPGPLVREGAAVALGHLGLPAALPALRRALGDADAGVALGAAWALVKLGDRRGVPLALAHLGSARADLALRAADVIEETRDTAYLPALGQAPGSGSGLVRRRMRTAAESIAMAQLDEAGRIAACERILADPEEEIRAFGAAGLRRIGTPAALAALARAASENGHAGRREAQEAAAAPPEPPVVE